MAIGDLLRYAFITLIFLVLLAFGLRWWGKHKTQKEIVRDLQSLTSTTASFEQVYEADAKKSLFLAINQLHLAEKKLGLTPREMLDKVFETRKEGGMFDPSDPSSSRRVDPGEALIREGLLRNYELSNRYGFFTDTLGMETLARGEAPQIQTGPASGKIADVGHVISPDISPGIEKIIPNLVIRPPGRSDAPPTEFEIAQAKLLANSLHDANILERKARDRIIEAYDQIGQEPEPDADADAE